MNIKGAEACHISIQHVLVKDWVVEYYEWLDCMRGCSTGNCRKVIQHLLYVANFALVLFPPLKAEYGEVPDAYRRLATQLGVIEKQQSMTQSDLIREGLWLPFPVIIELASNRVAVLEGAIHGGVSRKRCAELALEAAVMTLLSRRSWRSVELTSLELVSEQELNRLAKGAGVHQSKYLEICGRNFIVRSNNGKWSVLSNTFKTVESQKHVEDTLMPSEAQAMDVYVGYRNDLLGARSHQFAFVGPTGRQLTGSDIADMFQRLTNVRLLCNVRRKATITWALAQPNMDRESLARICRHTQSQQLRVYDQRSNDVRTGPALERIEELATSLGQKVEQEPGLMVKLGDIVRYHSSDGSARVGKVVDLSPAGTQQQLTLVLMEQIVGETISFKPIFGNKVLLEKFPVYEPVSILCVANVLK